MRYTFRCDLPCLAASIEIIEAIGRAPDSPSAHLVRPPIGCRERRGAEPKVKNKSVHFEFSKEKAARKRLLFRKMIINRKFSSSALR
jgi:hypothetical protein